MRATTDGFNETWSEEEPTRDEVDALKGPALLEFGAPWCGWCKGAQPKIRAAMEGHPKLPHTKIYDGKGKPLGRSYRVKLWPTLIFLQDGREVARLVRPDQSPDIAAALAAIE